MYYGVLGGGGGGFGGRQNLTKDNSAPSISVINIVISIVGKKYDAFNKQYTCLLPETDACEL